MKKPCLLLVALLMHSLLFAQNPSKVTIKGIVVDSSGTDLPFATVMLLNPKDSALINFTRGDDKGGFEFKNVKNNEYLLKIGYVGYIPFQLNIPPSVNEVNQLGSLKLKPITKELLEVVVKTARAPLSIKGDTIEYDARAFKVPPGSTVEDLLRRLPGIDVDADGNIKAQGKDVKRVYVDGKTFFGDDPKAATKNLDAETISKVQVFNEKSEQAKLTGIDDGKKEKAMNLELKEEFKKGQFGKLTGAVGTEERWAARGNYNRFNKKEQFSILGFANNINQTGVNWEDYGEFKGQNSFNIDNGDFGFNYGGGGNYFYSIDVPFFNNFDGRGFTKNFGSGANYNYTEKKHKLNAMYFYNQVDLNLNQTALRQAFLQNNSFSNTDTTRKEDFRGNHNVSGRWEFEKDSNNTFITMANLRFSNSNTEDIRQQRFFNTGITTNTINFNNNNDLNSYRLTSSIIYRHKFKKKGRVLAMSGGYNSNTNDATEDFRSLNRFFNATTFEEQIRQLNTNENATSQIKSSMLFTEPLSKKFFYEAFYNFSHSDNDIRRQVLNPERNNERVDNLSVFYDNKLMYNRLGTSVRYGYEGINISLGLAAQRIDLNGEYSVDRNMPLLAKPLNRHFNNITPNFAANFEFKNNMYLNFEYSYRVKEPQVNDLQPVLNVTNPAFRVEGNPNLTPELGHNFGFDYNYWNPASMGSIGFNIEYLRHDSRIAYSQTIENIDRIGIVTTTRPENIAGGYTLQNWIWGNYPIIKTKLTFNINGGFNLSNTPAFVNNVKNITDNKGYNIGFGLNLTPSQKLILGLDARLNNSNIEYSIQKEQNQKIRNQTVDASIKWNFISKVFLESNFNYGSYTNDQFNFSRNVPIWNASIRRLFGKNNKLEMRLAAFDILNKRVSINQTGTQNFISTSVAETLARYFMLSATYNMRGFDNKLSKNNWW